MGQRVPRRAWHGAERPGHRPRVLVEDDRNALAISDFSEFERAGFDVAYCPGPGNMPGGCPLARGRDCGVVAGADAVLHGPGIGLAVAAEIRRRYPGVVVLVERDLDDDGKLGPVPQGCIPIVSTCSVKGRVDALWRALAARSRPAAARPGRRPA